MLFLKLGWESVERERHDGRKGGVEFGEVATVRSEKQELLERSSHHLARATAR